jgi:hypothetical protein
MIADQICCSPSRNPTSTISTLSRIIDITRQAEAGAAIVLLSSNRAISSGE